MGKHLILGLMFFVSSCSSYQLQKAKSKELSPHQNEASVDDEKKIKTFREKAEKRLGEVTKEAIESGKQAILFLSSDLYIKANDASMRGDSATAALLFKYVYLLVPEDHWVQRKYAVELIRVGELEKSEKILSKIYQSNEGPEDENIGLILGGVLTALDQPKKAREVYKSVMKTHPLSEEACVFLSKSYALEKKYKLAVRQLKSCEKKIKGKAVFSYFRGKMSIDLGNRQAAAKNFRHALKIDKTYFQAAIALGLLYEEKELFDKAVSAYEKYLKNDEMNLPVLSRLVQVLFANGKYEKVLPYAEKLSSIDQSDLNLKVRLGILYTDKKKYDDAIGIFKEILQVAPQSDKILYYLGSLLQQTFSFHEAISFFQQVPSESTLFLDSHLQIAQMLQSLALDDSEKWEPELLHFLKKSQKFNDKARIEIGVLISGYWEGKNDLKKAIALLESFRQYKDFSEVHEYYLASLYEKNTEVHKARKLIEEMIKKNPENAHALNFLGYSLLENDEDMDRAFQLISKAVKLRPEDGFIRDSLAWFYYKVGQYGKALKEARKAYGLVDNDVVITKHLAIIHKAMKKYKLAKKYYVKALEQCKVESERKDVLLELEDLEKIRFPASQVQKKVNPED